jgi:hypothetical protein
VACFSADLEACDTVVFASTVTRHRSVHIRVRKRGAISIYLAEVCAPR